MKVLIAYDGSGEADKAFDWYFKNLHKDGNEVLVFSHSDLPRVPTPFLGGMPTITHEQIDMMMHEHNKKVKKLKKQLKEKCEPHGACVTSSVETEDGSVGSCIVKKAEEYQAEMIVTGTRGLGKLSRVVLGSVSSYVLHHAKIPIFICR